MLEAEKVSIGNGIMRMLSDVAVATLKGKVPCSVLPHWTDQPTWMDLLDAADAWQSYCETWGWDVSPSVLLSDFISDHVWSPE